MLAILACAILQGGPLGVDPVVWECKEYGLTMSYPREWRDGGPLMNLTVTSQHRRDESIKKCLLDIHGEGSFPPTVRIYGYQEPPITLVHRMDQWPKPLYEHAPFARELSSSLLIFPSPVEIGSIKGYARMFEMSILASALERNSSVTLNFKTPDGHYMEIEASTTYFPDRESATKRSGETTEPKTNWSNTSMKDALPIFNAMVRSIKFMK